MKFNIYESNPVLQGMASGNQILDKIVTKMKGAYKDLAVGNLMGALNDLDKPPDYKGMRERAKAAYETPEGVNAALAAAMKDPKADSATLAYLADKIAMGARRVELQNYLGQVDSMQRNEAKRQLLMNNLGLISTMNEGERSALNMGLSGANAAMTDAASGHLSRIYAGLGGRGVGGIAGLAGAKNEWSLVDVMVGGKSVKALFNKDTGEYRITELGGTPGGSGGSKSSKIESLDWGPFRAVEYTAEAAKATKLGKGERWEPHPDDPTKVLRLIPDKAAGGGGGGGGGKFTTADEIRANNAKAKMDTAQEEYDIALEGDDQDAIAKARAKLQKSKRDYNAIVTAEEYVKKGYKPANPSLDLYKENGGASSDAGGSTPAPAPAPQQQTKTVRRMSMEYISSIQTIRQKYPGISTQQAEEILRRNGYTIK